MPQGRWLAPLQIEFALDIPSPQNADVKLAIGLERVIYYVSASHFGMISGQVGFSSSRPVSKVVALLQGMKENLESEASEEAELMEKYNCWCKDSCSWNPTFPSRFYSMKVVGFHQLMVMHEDFLEVVYTFKTCNDPALLYGTICPRRMERQKKRLGDASVGLCFSLFRLCCGSCRPSWKPARESRCFFEVLLEKNM